MSSELDREDGFSIDLPEQPEYSNQDRKELDDGLEHAIQYSDKIGNDYLSRVLRAELGCVRLDGGQDE